MQSSARKGLTREVGLKICSTQCRFVCTTCKSCNLVPELPLEVGSSIFTKVSVDLSAQHANDAIFWGENVKKR